jgi:hypothetical protein
MNGIVLKRTCGARWHMNVSPAGPFFSDEGTITSNLFLGMLENYAFSQLNNNSLFSSTRRCTCSFLSHYPWLFERKFSRSMDRNREPNAWPPHSPDLKALDFFFGAMSKTRCTAKEWIRWMNSKHESLQQLQMYKVNVEARLARGGL